MIIRLRRYVEHETIGDDGTITVTQELVLDKGLRVHVIPRTGEYVGYDRYEGGKSFMVKSVEHVVHLSARPEADHTVIVVLA